MGWLDNSTNNIILDAVLTDYGRQALAQASQTTTSAIKFNFIKYALGDDEINYDIIKQYGRTVGREKIEKNTPIFEAFTNQSIALKNKLFSSAIPLLYIPKYQISSPSTPISLTVTGTAISNEIVIAQTAAQGQTLDGVKDVGFNIFVPSLFLNAVTSGNASSEIAGFTQQSTIKNYSASTDNGLVTANDTLVQLKFKLRVKTLPQSIFDVYGNSNNVINTVVRVSGVTTGVSIDIPVSISYT